jgi:hypothetical protein
VKKDKNNYIDIEIDKLTNSIENTLTGEVFDTEITQLKLTHIKQINKADWAFDWLQEIKDKSKLVYKLTTVNNPDIIQGLISLQHKDDHIFMHLIENAKFNKGKAKAYFGVPGNLVAFACKLSFESGFDGFLAFDAKTALIKHYEQSLGAKQFKGLRMIIDSNAAIKLVRRYFKN